MVALMACLPSRLSALVAMIGKAPVSMMRSSTRRMYLSYSWAGFSDHHVSMLTITMDGLHTLSSQSNGDSFGLQDFGSERKGDSTAAALNPPLTARLLRENEP